MICWHPLNFVGSYKRVGKPCCLLKKKKKKKKKKEEEEEEEEKEEKAVITSEMSVSAYETTHYRELEGDNPIIYCSYNLRSYAFICLPPPSAV